MVDLLLLGILSLAGAYGIYEILDDDESVSSAGISLSGGQGDDLLIGTNGNDLLSGALGNDILNGLGGNDQLTGGPGADTLDGGTGNDLIEAGRGDDLALGHAGNDRIFTSEGDDLADGGTGDDTLQGGPGQDVLIGGAGNDLVQGSLQSDLLIGGQGADVLTGGFGNDVLIGGDLFSRDLTDTELAGLHDGAQAETAINLPPDVTLRLQDDGEPDELNGGAGNDIIYLMPGDTGTGEDGADDFILTGSDSKNLMEVNDFNPAEDVLVYTYPKGMAEPDVAINEDDEDNTLVYVNGALVARLLQADFSLVEVVLMERT